jgi:hypothetical protein
MAKLADNITKILAAAGVQLTAEQTAVLAELPQDEVSPTVQTLFDTAANQATSELAKIAAKASNLDKFDTGIESWADLLGDDIKTIAKEKGPQKLEKIKAQIAKKIEEAKTAAATGQNPDLEKLKGEIVALQQKAQTVEAEKTAEVEKVKSEYEGKIFNSSMLNKLQGRKDIIDAYSSEDALRMLVLPKIMQHIEAKGLKINPDKLDVVTKDTGVPYIKGAKVVTLDEMFEEALAENKFRQNAGPTPGKTTIETGGSEPPKVTKTSLLRPEVSES